MATYTREFSDMKQIFFALLLASFCSIAINCTPIATTPAGEANNDDGICEDLSTMMDISQPILDEIAKYFITFNNSDLLSLRATCKWFNKYASKILNERIKPLIIINGTISGTTDQQIFSAQMSTSADLVEFKPFLALEKPQYDTVLLFDDCNNPMPSKHLPRARVCLQITPYDSHIEIHALFYNRGKLGNNHPRSGVIIPQHQYRPIMHGYNSVYIYNAFRPILRNAEWMQIRNNVKLIMVFQNSDLLNLSIIDYRFVQFAKKYPVPICYALQSDRNLPNVNQNLLSSREFIWVIFYGDNIEVVTFPVETIDEKELRQKLLIWKRGLDFLESHHIIAFHFTKELMEPINSEEIFKDVFGIQPATLRLSASEFAKTGLVYCNSTDIENHQGPVYAIVGFTKFSATINLL